jgi:cAMP receptor-like G-protein coupled receptor
MSEGRVTLSQLEAVIGVASLTSALSIVGSGFILVCYAALPRLRRLSFTLVAALSVTDVFNQLWDLIGPPAADLARMQSGGAVTTLCLAQSAGDNLFELASVLWTAAIAAHLYMTVIWRWRLPDTWATLGKFAAVCFTIPLILTIVPGAMGAFGPAGESCWITDDYAYMRWVCFYVPLWAVFAFNAAVYVRVLSLLRATAARATPGDAAVESIRAISKRLNVYPFILLAVWTFPSINQVVESAGKRQVFGLFLVASASAGLQGLLNALAYGLSGGVRDAVRDVLAGWCPRCIKSTAALASDKLLAHHAPHGHAAGAAGHLPTYDTAGIDLEEAGGRSTVSGAAAAIQPYASPAGAGGKGGTAATWSGSSGPGSVGWGASGGRRHSSEDGEVDDGPVVIPRAPSITGMPHRGGGGGGSGAGGGGGGSGGGGVSGNSGGRTGGLVAQEGKVTLAPARAGVDSALTTTST